jgi:hypothetical protein
VKERALIGRGVYWAWSPERRTPPPLPEFQLNPGWFWGLGGLGCPGVQGGFHGIDGKRSCISGSGDQSPVSTDCQGIHTRGHTSTAKSTFKKLCRPLTDGQTGGGEGPGSWGLKGGLRAHSQFAVAVKRGPGPWPPAELSINE